MSRGGVAIAFALVSVAACSSTPVPSPEATASATPTAIVPSASAAAKPSAPEPTATALSWQWLSVGDSNVPAMPSHGDPTIASADFGYAAIVGIKPHEVSFSRDGLAWTQQGLPSDGEAFGAASDPTTIVLGGNVCASTCKATTFVTDDGISWSASGPLVASDGTSPWEVHSLWKGPAGWEATTDCDTGSATLWRSPDARRWSSIDTKVDPCSIVGVAPDGTYLLHPSGYDSTALETSTDLQTTTPIRTAFDANAGEALGPILALSPDGPQGWLVIVVSAVPTGIPSAPSHADAWFSPDLVHWSSSVLPGTFVNAATATSQGYIIDLYDRCIADETHTCPPLDDQQLISADGKTWRDIQPHVQGSARFLVNDSGVLMLDAEHNHVWRLTQE